MGGKDMKKQFWKKRFFIINVDVFGVDILVGINVTRKEVEKYIKKKAPKKYKIMGDSILENWDDDLHQGQMIPIGGSYVILLKAHKDYFRKFIGVLTHEVTHATHYLLRERRIPLTEDSEEIYTYLNEYLVKEILYKLY